MAGRRLDIAGTFNVRDVGGYPANGGAIRSRTLLRGDALHDVDEVGRARLVELGLRTSIDLREEEERRRAPSLLPPEVRVVEIPLFTYAAPDAIATESFDHAAFDTLSEIYAHVVRARGDVIVEIVRALLAPDALPAIVHCTGGKDRTGITIAVILSALGVPDEIVAADYAATSIFLGEEFQAALLARSAVPGIDRDRLARMLTCEPELILDVLDEIRTDHGSVEQYLFDHGFTVAELDHLRRALVNPVRPLTPMEDN
jgi:protein-tyrosine phosphatase